MVPRRTFVVSVHSGDDHLLLEDVRNRRRVRLGELSEIAQQIERWLEREGPEERRAKPAPEAPA